MNINRLSFEVQIKTDIYGKYHYIFSGKKCTKIEQYFCKSRNVINFHKKVINKRPKNAFSSLFDRCVTLISWLN